MGIISTIFLDILIGLVTALLTMLIFDINKLKYRLSRIFGFKFYKTFERLGSRKQIIKNFNKIFVSYKFLKGGEIMLMSNTGGYPEFDPYPRILELSNFETLDIYLAISKFSFVQYIRDNPHIAMQLITSKKIHIYIFENQIPYQYRIGVNTDLKLGFYSTYYGHNNNKVELEGIQSNNKLVIDSIKAMFFGLIKQGSLVKRSNLKTVLGYSYIELQEMKRQKIQKISI
ncbi:hypothetical protein [uncultured Lutibacter sp.]|uniref:hypothetical protein n=1 Tax=uncultured Lutibacter sp. TaxID=437739 RepID=UPI00262D813B|nr:hypothetical protein [uncultured Lutibacter sp.]